MLRHPALRLALLLSLALPPSCATTAPELRAERQKGVEAGDVKASVDPCVDFHEFASGAWRDANPIPPGRPRWSRRLAAREANRLQLQALLGELAARRDWPAGSAEQLVSDLHASCLDDGAVEAAGLTPLAPLLGEIDAARTRADVQRLIRRLHELAVPAPFGLTGAFDNHDPTRFVANVTAGGLGLPDREHYLSAEPRFVEGRDRYLRRVARVLELGGMPGAATPAAAEGVLALERRLAAASLDASTAADPDATEHPMTFAQLEALAPSFDWATYFDEARLPRVTLNVAEPRFLQQLDRELAQTPVAAWRTYLAWQLLASASPWLPSRFAEPGGETRAARCLELTEGLLGEAVGQVYVARSFPPAAKARAQALARSLLEVLEEDVAAVPWMGPETRQKAAAKLAVVRVQLGYPDRWRDHRGLALRRDALWSNVAQARRFNVDAVRAQVGQATDREGWLLPPSSPAAYLDLQLGELVLPAGFLQPPLFSLEATDAVNHGAMGAGLAHDLTHGVDATGAGLDEFGRPRRWWTDADREAFERRAQCVSEQYEGYFIEPGVHHDGKRVLSEAIADLGGLHLAYLALQRSMARRPVPVVDGFTPEQQFFLAWGQLRGEAVSIEAQREQVRSDPHPVARFRVNGPLSNLPEFQQAFSCRAGAPMVRPDERRCKVW